ALLQAFTIGGKPACRQVEDLGQGKKNGLEDLSFHYSIQWEALLHKRWHEGTTDRLPGRVNIPGERSCPAVG
ncbi:hypothetical protein CA603_40200, partial [Paraburkholderia hospita]